MEIQTTEEVINYILDNTYIGGDSLRQLNPEFEQHMAEAVAKAEAESEAFNLDKLRFPVQMHRRTEGHTMVFDAPRVLQYCTDTSC